MSKPVAWAARRNSCPGGFVSLEYRGAVEWADINDASVRPLYDAEQHDAELAELKDILPEIDDALESLEAHGRHSDQGYRELKDWYRKIAGITARIDAKLATLAATK